MNVTTECHNAQFATTHWTVVFAAAQTQSPEAQQALEALCCSYWYPLYGFARRRGASAHDAEDLTQAFFAGRVVTKLVLRGIDSKLGKFRTWLLNSFQNFMNNERARQHAQKRGGSAIHESLDLSDGEGRYQAEPACDATPEQFYDRAWGMTVFARGLVGLRTTYEQAGESALFEELASFLPGAESRQSYAVAAAKLRLNEAALKMRVSRLRQELGRLLRDEVKRTVSNADEAREELQYLITVLTA